MRLRRTLFILPNLFTLSSVFCGFYASFLSMSEASSGSLHAAWLIVFAMLFDTLDGRVARLTRTQSAFGVQLDSLADIVSFGVAPALLWFDWGMRPLGFAGIVVAFLYIACGAVRLARFNVISMSKHGEPRRPSRFILGLPIPIAAGVLVSIVIGAEATDSPLPRSSWPLAGVLLACSALMVSSVRFRSFKKLSLSKRSIFLGVLLVLALLVLSLRFHPAVALIVLLLAYISFGLIEGLFRLSRGRRKRSTSDLANPRRHKSEEKTLPTG